MIAEAAARVVAVDIDGEAAQRVARELGEDAIAVAAGGAGRWDPAELDRPDPAYRDR